MILVNNPPLQLVEVNKIERLKIESSSGKLRMDENEKGVYS